MSGHGHVHPNADGSRARCGGPGICPACSAEAMVEASREHRFVNGTGWVPPYSVTMYGGSPDPGTAPRVEPPPVTVGATTFVLGPPQRRLRVAVEVRDGKTKVLVSLDGVLVRSVECEGSVAIEEVI